MRTTLLMSVEAAFSRGMGPGSRRVTRKPRLRSSSAAVRPNSPAPTIRMERWEFRLQPAPDKLKLGLRTGKLLVRRATTAKVKAVNESLLLPARHRLGTARPEPPESEGFAGGRQHSAPLARAAGGNVRQRI